ncbi:MAG TPA: phage tail tube protein [bacterium]|nr:phage tail tube protein [bacterium]
MALKDTISSNSTELLAARQNDPKLIPQNADWFEREPNEYGDFGRQNDKVARRPINSSRMPKKGTLVGYKASAGFTFDFTSQNSLPTFEEFLFANCRRKGMVKSESILADGYVLSSGGTLFNAGDIIFVEGVSAAIGNLGRKILSADAVDAKISLAGLTIDADAVVTINRVGHRFASGDLSVSVVNGLPRLNSAAYDMTDLGLLPGEQVYIGSDDAANRFANAANQGWVRIKVITEDYLELDKTDAQFVVDAGAGKLVEIYFGDVVKNEAALENQVHHYVAFRRRLGQPTIGSNTVQSEVVFGNLANELTFSIPEKDKTTIEVAYMGRDHKSFDDDNDVDAGGNIIKVEEADALNSTGDLKLVRLWVYKKGVEQTASPTPLISGFTEIELNINNNLSETNVLTQMGTFAHTPGFFDIACTMSGCFVEVGAMTPLNENLDLTMSAVFARDNRGVGFDIPLMSGTSDGPQVEMNEPITIEIENEAADGRKYLPTFDHMLLVNYYNWLPSSATTIS